jgi:hypothetical protein
MQEQETMAYHLKIYEFAENIIHATYSCVPKDVITLGNYMRLIGMPDALANATNFVLTSSRDETPTQTENDEKKLELVFDGFINVSKSGIVIRKSHFLSTIYPSLLIA